MTDETKQKSGSSERLYSRLDVSCLDLDAASFSLRVVMKKGWHYNPWEKLGAIYQRQAAYTTALVVAYARPFNRSDGWPDFPRELMLFLAEEFALHKKIITLRNSVCAHSDGKMYSVRPWRAQGISTDIVGAPVVRITSEQGMLLGQMISKLQRTIKAKLKAMVPE